MKVLVTFPNKKNNDFEGSRLRKTIKGALELCDVSHTSQVLSDFDIVHLISVDEINKALEANVNDVPLIVSTLMCEGDHRASYLDYKFDDGKVSYTLKNKVIKLLNKVDHVIAPCENCKQYLIEQGVTTPIATIMPGVNFARFDFTREDEKQLFFRYFCLDNSKKLVIGNGDVEYLDGISSFIQAGEKCPDANFVFFLNGKIKSIKSKKIKLEIKHAPKNVLFSESVNDDIYRSALINASIFMMPCYHQNGVISILEAMASKSEIIMRSQDMLATFIKDNETVHMGKFSETLTSMCIDCLQGKLKSTITNAYEEAKKYSLETTGEQLKELYQQAITRKLNGGNKK